jgi:ribosome-associated protein
MSAQPLRPDAETPIETGVLSKTRRKQQMHALQALGERLVDLPPARLDEIPMDESLRQAIVAARTITAHEGRRRQLQYVGKLMRSADADAIASALDVDALRHRQTVSAMHAAERWRDALIGGERTLTEFVEQFPAAASLPLAQVVSQARREREAEKPPRHFRTLYRDLLAVIEDRQRPATSDDKTPDDESGS